MNEIQFLDYIVKSIVTNKDAVKIERKEDELGVLLTLSLDKADM
jgi:hypothetical protein